MAISRLSSCFGQLRTMRFQSQLSGGMLPKNDWLGTFSVPSAEFLDVMQPLTMCTLAKCGVQEHNQDFIWKGGRGLN